MTPTHNNLARMANGIAGIFRCYPEDEAIAAIHDRIVAFRSRACRPTPKPLSATRG